MELFLLGHWVFYVGYWILIFLFCILNPDGLGVGIQYLVSSIQSPASDKTKRVKP
jgi:hypothetical protein